MISGPSLAGELTRVGTSYQYRESEFLSLEVLPFREASYHILGTRTGSGCSMGVSTSQIPIRPLQWFPHYPYRLRLYVPTATRWDSIWKFYGTIDRLPI